MPPQLNFTEKIHHDIYPAIDPSGALKGVAEGKKALVTGAGRGIGKAVALALTRSGISLLILTSRTQSQLSQVEAEINIIASSDKSRKNPVRVILHETDVRNEESVQALFARLKNEKVGRLDLLVNNAGYLEKLVPFAERDWKEFQLSVDTNTKTTSLPTLLFLRHNLSSIPSSPFPSPPSLSPLPTNPTTEQYQQAFDGVTVICTSTIASTSKMPGFHAYQPTKVWTNRFAEFLHDEYATTAGLRSFVYHPGLIMTDLAQNMPPETHSTLLIDSLDLAGGFVVWLLKDEADFLRGRYSSSNWDVEEMVKRKEEILKDEEMLTTRVNFNGAGFGFS